MFGVLGCLGGCGFIRRFGTVHMAVWDGLQKAMGVGFNERLKRTQTDAASDLTSRGRVFNYTTSVKSSKLSSNPPSTSKCRSNPPSIKSSSLQRSPATQVNTPGPSIFGDVRRCSTMFGDVQRCSTMFGDVRRCSAILSELQSRS